MCSSTGVKYVYCEKNNVSTTIKNLLKELKENGFNPYYINGNEFGEGNDKTSSKAYCDVFNEIILQEKELNIKFDYIFLAVGTGMTIGGLIAGKVINNSTTKIIGISIARDRTTALNKTGIYANSILKFKDFNVTDFNVDISDNYLCGGYAKYNMNIKTVIKEMYLNEVYIWIQPMWEKLIME